MGQEQLLARARTFLDDNIKEVVGKSSHPQILEWIKRTEKHDPTDLTWDDSTYAWCGVFVGNMCLDLGWHPPDYMQRASNWRHWESMVLFRDKKPGDVVVMTRDGGFHVTILERVVDKHFIDCLGGNQSNKLNIQRYNMDRVIAIRRKA